MREVALTVTAAVLLLAVSQTFANEDLYKDPEGYDPAWPPAMLEILIPSQGEMLTGTYYAAAGKGPHPTIVTLHAFPGYEKNLDLAQSLRRIGYNVLYFDYRGVWGGPSDFSVQSGYEDSTNAVAFAADPANAANLRIDRDRIILLGHSFGAVAALDIGAENPAVRCIISLAPEDMTLMVGTKEDQDSLARYTDNLRVVSGYPGAELIDDLLANRDAWAMTTTIKRIGAKPYLMVGGGLDSNFDASEVAKVAAAGKAAGAEAMTAMVLENGDHSFSANRIELTETVADWLANDCD